MSDFGVGSVVAEKYRIERELGQGGAGKVYIARHLELDREVALKLLLDVGFQADEFRERFRREARVASRLQHDNAVEVYDFGDDAGTPYLVMELLSGKTLLDPIQNGPMPLDVVYALGMQIADVLHAAHQIELVHRDLKPENILIEERHDGTLRPVIVDFGLAFIAADNSLNRMTQEGVISGTPQYLSPEQALAEEIGPPSDVYSFGCVLYEMLTRRPVFADKVTVTLLAAHVYTDPIPMRSREPDLSIPASMDELVLSMLAKAPEDRPTAAEVRDILSSFARHDPVPVRGRPRALNDVRSRRAVTRSQGAPTLTRKPDSAREERGVIGVIGESDSAWTTPLAASGWRCEAFSGQSVDLVFVADPEFDFDTSGLETDDLVVLAAADATDFDRCTHLLKTGVTDVVPTPLKPSKLLKKIERAARKIRRGKGTS